MISNLQLAAGETLITNPQELLYRQIADWMAPGGALLTHVFGPSTSDAGKPSYSRSSVVTAQDARDWYEANARGTSVGVYGVTVDEVLEVGRWVIDDSGAPVPQGQSRAPGHCFVDFRDMPKPLLKSVRYLLFLKATGRGEIATSASGSLGSVALEDA